MNKSCKKCKVQYVPTMAYQVYCNGCKCDYCNKLKFNCTTHKTTSRCYRCNHTINNSSRFSLCVDCSRCKGCNRKYTATFFGDKYYWAIKYDYCKRCHCQCCLKNKATEDSKFCDECLSNGNICSKCKETIITFGKCKKCDISKCGVKSCNNICLNDSKYCINHNCCFPTINGKKCPEQAIYCIPRVAMACEKHSYCSLHTSCLIVRSFTKPNGTFCMCINHCFIDNCGVNTYNDFYLCQSHQPYWSTKVKKMLLCQRSLNPASFFYKDNFPLDMFKIIFRMLLFYRKIYPDSQ